ncbi:MAG: hypothetical protein ACYDAG_15550 [Chloroflexota bacterium]
MIRTAEVRRFARQSRINISIGIQEVVLTFLSSSSRDGSSL